MRAPNFVGCVRARGLRARQPAAAARWLLKARSVAKTDARIVFLAEFWVYIVSNRILEWPCGDSREGFSYRTLL